MVKKLVSLLVIVTLLVLVAFLLFRTTDTDADAMRTKYGTDDSQQVADGYGGFIHYRDQGLKDGLPLLLLHGSNSSLQTWEPLVARLAENFRLISFDQHGHGLTGPHAAANYTAAARIEAALKVLDAVGVEKAVWIGNSMGGWVTWRAALAVPERLEAMVLIDASGVQNVAPMKPYFGARLAGSAVGQLLLPHITPRWLVQASLEENYFDPARLSSAEVDCYWELLRYPGNRQASVAAANADREAATWNRAHTITLPTLLLWGEHDSVIPVAHAEEFHRTISGSVLKTYPDAGHLPMAEIPAQVAADIANWLNARGAGGQP